MRDDIFLKLCVNKNTHSTVALSSLLTCPACDSLPGLLPKPPSKFWHLSTNSAALLTSIASNRF